jgi:hypothetical protein
MGVAHAPLAFLLCCDHGTGLNPGGTERRPILGTNRLPRKDFWRGVKRMRYWTERSDRADRTTERGTVLPNFRSPTPFPPWRAYGTRPGDESG